jgi:DHA1 family multidrug resistance protein-like MFS transporter
MTDSLSATAAQVGILYALTSLTAALTLLLAGMMADKYDRKKIMIAGWVAWLPAPIIFSLAQNWLQMLPGMILWGFWLGGPTGTAYIVTTAEKSKLTSTFTTLSAAWSVGYTFSPALGGYIAGIIGMKVVFYMSFILYGSATAILFFIRSQKAANSRSTEENQSLLKLLRTKKLVILSAYFALMMFALMLMRPFIPNFLGEKYGYSDFEIGILGSFSFFGSAVLGMLLGRLADQRKKAYALAGSMLLTATSLTLLLQFNNYAILLIALFLAGGSYMIWSLMGAVVGPLAPECIRARWVCIPQSLSMLTSFIAPYIGGLLYEASPYYPFLVTIAIAPFLAIASFGKVFEQ